MTDDNFNPCGKLFRGKNNYNLYNGIAYSLDMEQLVDKSPLISMLPSRDIDTCIVQETPVTDTSTCSLGATVDKFTASMYSLGGGAKVVAVSPLPKQSQEPPG